MRNHELRKQVLGVPVDAAVEAAVDAPTEPAVLAATCFIEAARSERTQCWSWLSVKTRLRTEAPTEAETLEATATLTAAAVAVVRT